MSNAIRRQTSSSPLAPSCDDLTPGPTTTPVTRAQTKSIVDSVPDDWHAPLAAPTLRALREVPRSPAPLSPEQLKLWPETALTHEASRLQRSLATMQNYPARAVEESNLRAIAEELARRDPTAQDEVASFSMEMPSEKQLGEVALQISSAFQSVLGKLAPDAPIRAQYVQTVERESALIVDALRRGRLTPDQAATMANHMRNEMLQATRKDLTPVGATISRFLKEQGLTLEQACQRQAQALFKRPFATLSSAERAQALEQVAVRAGVTNELVNFGAQHGAKIGKALLAVSIAVAVYKIAESEDRVREATRQACSMAGGMAGAAVGAKALGALCGMTVVAAPAVPACILVGMVAGGVVGSLAAEEGCDYGLRAAREEWGTP